MNILDSRVYRALDVFASFLILNGMWLLACVPVVTFFPATAAMFGVVRDWVRHEEVANTWSFFSRFRQLFKQSFGIGLLWTAIGTVLLLDLYLLGNMDSAGRVILQSLIFLMLVLYAFVSAFLFPVLVHYDAPWRVILKNSLLLSMVRLPTTLLCLVIFAFMVGLTLALPLTLLITGSLTAYLVYRLCDRAFSKVASATPNKESSRESSREAPKDDLIEDPTSRDE